MFGPKSLAKKEQSLLATNVVDMQQKQHGLKQNFNLGGDTYAQAFKALHWESAQQMNLSVSEVMTAFHSMIMVAFVQFFMLYVVTKVIFGGSAAAVQITMASTVTV